MPGQASALDSVWRIGHPFSAEGMGLKRSICKPPALLTTRERHPHRRFRPLARYPPSRRIEDAVSPDTLPREKNANPCWFLCKSDLKMDRNAAVIPQFMPIGRAVCVPGGKAFPPQGVSAGTGVALSAAPAQSSVDKASFHPIEREVFSRFPLGIFIRMP